VSVLDGGRKIRFADQGPGFSDSGKATRPGFTTATAAMKRFIRGVGSGLPIVSAYLEHCGGHLTIEDNLGRGSVVTVSVPGPGAAPASFTRALSAPELSQQPVPRSGDLFSDPAPGHLVIQDQLGASAPTQESPSALRLSMRQKQVLALVLESGSAGPSIISRELGVGLSTAYRDLAALEQLGLIVASGGKRTLTDEGARYLDHVLSAS
jgi:hypothetical protein